MRSGYANLIGHNNAVLIYAGAEGDWWSSRGVAINSAYHLTFATTVYPSYGPYNRWSGLPLRCLSTVLGM